MKPNRGPGNPEGHHQTHKEFRVVVYFETDSYRNVSVIIITKFVSFLLLFHVPLNLDQNNWQTR